MIYLDNAASTAPAPEMLHAMAAAAGTFYANPSSAHGLGAAAARALAEARAGVARLFGAAAGDVIFTSGGTEANALGTLGVAAAARGRHVVVSAIEHPAVLRSIAALAQRGFAVSMVAPGPDGVVSAEAIVAATRPDTALVALMLVNNELGTLQPVAAVARALRAAGLRAHIHCDAVQSAGLHPVDVKVLGVDSVALSAHKLHGPKGIGALWLRPGARLEPLWDGGRQEKALRSGTENLPGAVGFARAAALALGDSETRARVAALRDEFEAHAARLIPEARPTVPVTAPRTPHIASLLLPTLPAEPLLHALEARAVFASAGSACASRNQAQSHVLAAIGVPSTAAVLRFSFGRYNAAGDPEAAALALRAAVDEVAPFARLQGASRSARNLAR
ncbi:MAG TPA: cysteine desulfurase family protein [Polyangia bacterium]